MAHRPTDPLSVSVRSGLRALLLLAGLGAAGGAVAAPFQIVDCASLGLTDLPDEVECGRLAVAEGGRSTLELSLPVVILRAQPDQRSVDAILYLHGGPGIATVENTPRFLAADGVKALRQHADYVYFDQRGSGQATPALCPDFDAAVNAIDAQAPPPAIGLLRKRNAAIACAAHLQAQGRDPARYTSRATADDAEALRLALGYRQWDVVGTSYGSFPAVELARRHPDSVRTLVLNSPFPPNSPNRAEQFSTTAEGLAALQAGCDADPACHAAHPDLRGDAASAIARLNAAPLPTDDGQISGMTFLHTFWTLLVQGKTAPQVPELLARAAAGDDASVRTVAAPFSGADTWGTFAHAQSWLVSCHDIYPRPSADAVRAAMAKHPAFAQDIAPEEQDVICDVLQPAHAPDDFYAATPLAVPALVYAGEYDPATPTSDALATMAMMPHATLIQVRGASHAPLGTDACTRAIAVEFLATPTQAPDIRCLQQRPAPTFADAEAFEAFLRTLE